MSKPQTAKEALVAFKALANSDTAQQLNIWAAARRVTELARVEGVTLKELTQEEGSRIMLQAYFTDENLNEVPTRPGQFKS